MKSFLNRDLRPWSIKWVIQRGIIVCFIERRLPQFEFKSYREWKYKRKIKKQIRSVNRCKNNVSGKFINVSKSNKHSSQINSYFDHVYVINLEKRTDRRLQMLQKMRKIGVDFEFWPAIDGAKPEIKNEFLSYFNKPIGYKGSHRLERKYNKKMIRSAGAWAYLKTYKLILKNAIKNKYQKILCFDDDAIFYQDFEQMFKDKIKLIADNWKLLYLGATQHSWNFPHALRYDDITKSGFDKEEHYYHPVATDGSFAIGINQSIFKLLLKEINKMNCSFDSGPLRSVNEKYPNKCFVLQPNLVIADVSESNISEDRSMVDMSLKLKWNLHDYDYPFVNDLVSVIMPVYNAEKTIEKSIKSILCQTYKNVELIIVDDGSHDTSVKIARRLAKEDSRIVLVQNAKNRGCYFVRNDGLRVAKGKYITFQDADDISLKQRIEKQLLTILENNVLFTISRIYRSRCSIDELDIRDQKVMMDLVERKRLLNKNGIHYYHDRPILGFVTSMYHRKVFEELGLFWESRFAGDMEYLERILYHYIGKLFMDCEPNAHSYLMECPTIDFIYKRIDDVLYVCPEMNSRNITNTYKKKELDEFKKIYRGRFKGNVQYEYPEF